MPEDKLSIPKFAAKIKAKYPEYKDVNDTLLVKRIVEKYPEYKESVDLSGLEEPVKKKFGSEIGGKVGSSVGRLDVGAGITEIDDEGKPLGKALGKVSGITTPEQAKISRVNKAFGKIESFAGSREDFEEIYKQAPQEFDNLAKQVAPNVNKGEIDKFYTTEIAQKDAYLDRVFQSYNQQKTKAILDYSRTQRPVIDENFNIATNALSSVTGKQYQLPKSEAEVNEILGDIANEKEKIKSEFVGGWDLKSAEEKFKKLSEIEGKVKQNLTYQVGRMALEKLSQNNPNVTSQEIGKEIFRVLRPDEYYLYEKVKGDKPISFTVGITRDTPQEADMLNEEMVKLGNEIKRTYGNEYAIQNADVEEQTANRKFTFHKQARVKQKIAAILHERGLSPHKATEELMDKVADKYLNEEDRDIYYNHNKPNNNLDLPSTGLGYSLKNMYNEIVGNSVKTLLSPLLPGKDRARAASVLADMSESKELGEDPQSKARLDQLNDKVKEGFTLTDREKEERESLEKYTNIRSKWEKRFDLAGTGLGTILGMGTVSAFTGGLLNARNLPTAVKSLVAPSQASMRGRLVTSALSFYESNAQNALKEYPNDKDWLKRGVKAGLDTAVDSLTEMIFPEEKVLSGVGKRQVAKMISNLTAENLTRTLNSNVFKDIARAMVSGSKRLIATPSQEMAEELIAATLKEAYDGAINPDPDRQALDLKQMVEIGESTLWSSALLGVPKTLFGGKSNKVPLNILWDSVSNEDGYITQRMNIERLKESGELTEQEANDRVQNLNLGRQEYLNNPILSGDEGNLDATQKQNYLARLLNEAMLKKQAQSVIDPTDINKKIKESQAIREKIYKGDIKVTPENEELTKKEFEKQEAEKTIIDQDRVLGDEEVELTPEQKILQQAIDNNEVEGMFLDMAKSALSDPQQAKQLLDEAKSQATGQVAGELGSARSGVEKAWGKSIADFVAPQGEAAGVSGSALKDEVVDNEVSKKYFSDEAFKKAKEQEANDEGVLVMMPIDDFLAVNPIHKEGEKTKLVADLAEKGTKFNEIPFLTYTHTPNGTAIIQGHEGRHRAAELKKRGETVMPVLMKNVYQNENMGAEYVTKKTLADPNSFNEETSGKFPEKLHGASDGRENTVPFPITREGKSKFGTSDEKGVVNEIKPSTTTPSKAPTQYTEAAGVSGSALKDVDLVKDNGKKIISKALGENGNDASDFKNTKVVDDNGKPKQVFHGTWADAPFEDFKEGDTYFTDNYDTAKMFGSNREGGVDTENMDMQGKPFVMEVTDTKGKKHKMVIANTDMASIFSDLQYDVSPVGEWGKEDLNDFDASSIEHHFGVPKNKIKSFKIEERQVGKNVDDFGVSRHYINLENPLIIDAKGDIWNGSKGGDIQGKINEARESGKHDGVIVKNIVEGGLGNPDTKPTTTYVVFNKNPKAPTQHSIDITPELKAEVEGGLPLFRDIKGRGKEIADLLRKGKIKIGGFQSNIAGLPIAIYNAAVETVALAIEGGATLAAAIKKAIKDHNLNQQKNFNQNEFIAKLEEAAGEKLTEDIGTPTEPPPTEKKDEGGKKKSLLNRIFEGKKTPQYLKDRFLEEGLTYTPQSFEEANDLAAAAIEELGMDEALSAAEGNKLPGGVNTAVFSQVLNRLYEMEQSAASQQEKEDLAEKQAEIYITLDKLSREKGRDIAQIADLYKKSPLAVIMYENQKRQEDFEQWAKPKNKSWKEFYEELMKEPEFESVVKEQIREKLKSERVKSRAKRVATVRDAFRKAKDAVKGKNGAVYSTIIPPQVFTAALDIMEKAYLAGEAIVDVVQQGIDYITTEIKTSNWDSDKFRKEWEEKLGDKSEKQPLTDEEIKTKILDKFRKKLQGLTDKQKEEVVRKAFEKIVDAGGLDYDDFKQIIQNVVGRGELTFEQKEKIKQLVKATNSVEDAAKKAREERTDEAIKEFRKIELEAAKANRELQEILWNKPDIIKRLNSIMQLNTLGVVALVNNPIYNMWNQAFVRLPIGLFNDIIDRGVSAAMKIVGKEYQREYNVLETQKEFFKKLGFGSRESVQQLLTGLNRMDYIQKELYGQQIRPARAIRDLMAYAKGDINLSKRQVLDKSLQATVGVPAEAVARLLNIGDKPQRFAAEGAQASAFAKALGLKDIDYRLFIEFPKEEAYRVYKQQGLSEEEAKRKSEYVRDVILKEGQRSTFQQDNLLTEVLNRAFSVFGGKESGTAQLVKTLTVSPYIKIPSNAYWSYYNLVNPEVAILQSLAHAGRAAYFKKKGDKSKQDLAAREARYWLGHAATGMAMRAVVVAMVGAGIFVPANTGDDAKKEREGESFFEPQGTVNVTKLLAWLRGEDPSKVKNSVTISNRWFGQWATVGNAVARKYEEMTPEQRENQQEFWNIVLGGMEIDALKDLEQGVFSNTSSALNALNNGGSYANAYFVNTLNMFTNIVQPATFAQIARNDLPYYSSSKADTFLKQLENEAAKRSLLFRKLSGVEAPAKLNMWGEPMLRKGNLIEKMFGINKVNKDNFAQPIYEDAKATGDIGFFPPAIPNRLNNVKLSTSQQNELHEYVGQARKALVAPYINDSAIIEGFDVPYSKLSLDNKKWALEYLYQVGREQGVIKFVEKYPEFSKVVNEEQEETNEKRSQFRNSIKEKIE